MTPEPHPRARPGGISAFDFRSVPILTALRRLLSTFKLPGEAQKIDRVVQAFADHWFASNGGVDLRDEAGVPLNPFTSADGPPSVARRASQAAASRCLCPCEHMGRGNPEQTLSRSLFLTEF